MENEDKDQHGENNKTSKHAAEETIDHNGRSQIQQGDKRTTWANDGKEEDESNTPKQTVEEGREMGDGTITQRDKHARITQNMTRG